MQQYEFSFKIPSKRRMRKEKEKKKKKKRGKESCFKVMVNQKLNVISKGFTLLVKPFS